MMTRLRLPTTGRAAGRRRPALAAATLAGAVLLGVAVSHVHAQGAFERFVSGRPAAVPAEARADRIEFRHLGTEQGLPSAAVNAVAQDALGFVWIATPEGLVRYDGAEMRTFRHASSDTTTVPGNVATALAALPRREGAPGGALYVGTTTGLARYDPAREAFTRIAGLPAPDVTAVAVDTAGGAWATLRGGGLVHVPRGATRARAFRHRPADRASLPSDGALAVLVDADQTVWVGTDAGVSRVNPRTGHVRTFRADSVALAPVAALARRAAGGLYVGTQGTGLWILRPKDGQFTRVPLGDDLDARVVSSVHEDGSGTLWVGLNGGGLRRVVPGTAPVVYTHRADDATSLVANEVSALMEDRQGVLWVATYGGLDRFDLARGTPVRFRADATDPDALSSNTVLSVLPTDSALYVGTDRSLDISTDGQSFRHVVFGISGGKQEHPVTALLQTGDGTVWAGTRGGGLYRMGPRGPDRAPVQSRVGGETTQLSVTALLGDPSGALWIGTSADGLLRYDPRTQQAAAYTAPLPSLEVGALARTADGRLWVGTAAGLCRLDRPAPPGAFTCFRAAPADPRALGNEVVVSLLATRDALWVGTRGGLHRLDPRQPGASFTRYTEATSDLPGDVVYAIAPGDAGLLWLTTSGGLVRFSPGPGGSDTGVFTQRLGRIGSAPVFNRALAWRDSLLYAGGTAGLIRTNPTDLGAINPNRPQVVLTGVDVGGRPVEPGAEAPLAAAAPVADEIRLDPDQNYLVFRFAGLHFSDPSAITYRYRLVGNHDDWRSAGTRREATYTNLDPGNYVFEVIARTSDGVESVPATILVHVQPPWYRTLWAYLAFVALGVLAFVQWGRWQQQRLLRRERERGLRRESELRAETAEAERRKAEAEAAALKAENGRATAELERAREVKEANTRLEAANERLETSLRDLKATQAQLVQSEKLASLGQLTAGIAHEIKNPLNFVNNFADLSVELASDLETDLRGHPERTVAEALPEVEDLLADLRENARRIREHGQRADRIVRAMLLHSRGGASERARVDINRYVDEYANLAYHGARANNSDFNVTLERDLAPDAGETDVVPQEFGRVLINLLTNAFHAVHARRAVETSTYQPTVRLVTRRDADGLTIAVQDNGTGIPDAVQQRIFEPFYTTKPTGEGTGLGLSLVHDIVTQVHGGEIRVESTEGEGTTFFIHLPDTPTEADADLRP